MNLSAMAMLGAITLATSLQAAEDQKEAEKVPPLSAAIVDFKDGSADLEGIGSSVSALLQAKVSIDSDATLVERAELNEILGEQELKLSDAVTPGQAAEVGQLTGAEVIVSGRVFTVKDRVYVVAKVVSTSSGRVFGATSSYEKDGKIDDAVDTLSKDVSKILKEQIAQLRSGQTLEARIADQLKAKLEKKASAKVYISVKEEILRAPVPDPAVQTELARTLQAAGWKVVEAENEADIRISGEAFAEVGSRRGNLWFTRARLEFKVLNAKGEVLKTDRVVCGNVDLTQAVSAKGALQKAGLLATLPVVNAWLAAGN